jgi:hypothetical protein
VTLPNTITTIGEFSFHNCTKLVSITLPASLLSIGDNAFAWCLQLASITIPDKVTTIENNAFAYCAELTEITLPASVTSLINGAFFECENLEAIHVDAANSNYSSQDGVLYNKDKTTLVVYPEGHGDTFTVPGTVTFIEVNAFIGNEKIKSVTLPNSLKIIGAGAFYDCTALTTATLPASVEQIGYLAFYNTAISTLTLPNSLEYIGYSAFTLTDITSVTIPKSIKEIGYGAFSDCPKLTSISVDPANVNWMSDNGVLYNKDQSLIHSYPAGKNGDFTIPASVMVIRGRAFSGCSGLTSVTISDFVTTIEPYAFEHCTGLTSVIIPNSVELIENGVFGHCTGLSSIKISGSVEEIGQYAFNYCSALKEVTVEWTNPSSVLINEPFAEVNIAAATLRVPIGTKSTYQAALTWRDFGTIVEYDPLGNEKIEAPTLKAYAANGMVHITGLQPGMPLSIYTLAGQLVYKGVARSTEAFIPLSTSGIYIVTSGVETVKVVVN